MKEEQPVQEAPCSTAKTDQTNKSVNQKTTSIQPAIHKTSPPGKCPIHVSFKDSEIQKIALRELSVSKHAIFQELTATKDKEISHEIILRGIQAMPEQHRKEHNNNTILQALADGTPKDSIEAKLYLQSTVLYAHGMANLERAEMCDRIDQTDFYMKNAIKLLRLHNETIEAINKHRRGGEQRVFVQYVNITEGGQAIVGGMFKGGGGNKKSDEVTPC